MTTVDVKCLCGETHTLPTEGRVWFLHPDNHEFAMGVMDGAPAIPCALMPRQQAANIDAQDATRRIGATLASEIV